MEQNNEKKFATLHYLDVVTAIKALEELEEGISTNLTDQEMRSLKKFKVIKKNMEASFHPKVQEVLDGKVVTINRVTPMEPEAA